MLNSSRVLDYVKSAVGFPFVQVELTDEQIMDYIKTYSLREFSQYVPWVKKIPMNLQLDSLKVSGRQNEFYIPAGTNEEIMNVVEVYFYASDYYFFGHPVMGPLSHEGLPNFALETVKAMDLKMFSSYDKTFEFVHPNILRVSPADANTSYVTVEVELLQPNDFSQIDNQFQVLFCKFAAADIKIKLGAIRRKYGGNLRTPFGEIPLDVEIGNEGKDEKRELLEKLENRSLPNCTIEIG